MKSISPEWIEYRKKMAAKRASFIAALDEDEKASIVLVWVEEHSAIHVDTSRSESERKLSICMSDRDLGWEMILRISLSTDNKHCLSRLGCWHVEEWLATHGEAVIDRVEETASKNIKIQRVLSCVYQNSMPPIVYSKVKTIALSDGYFDDIRNKP